MKKLLIALPLFFSLSAEADVVESIEKFTDVFSISATQVDGETEFKLDANYYLTESLRAFGNIDTATNWEVGFGYSFWSGETYFTENTIKATEHTYSTGLFAAKSLSDAWLVLGDVNYNYRKDIEDPFCSPLNLCIDNLEYRRADTVSYSLGLMWSPVHYADFMYRFNHEVGVDKDYLTGFGIDRELFPKIYDALESKSRFNQHYHEFSLMLEVYFLKPTVTYNVYEDSKRNYVEFGLSFDFK
ncbi:hypothetical protein H4F18_09275 [Vibrio scophthalmi]|uniref:hypothetical protein n=1 Tax=Vibrio scophthalmi TaxID=45658 RepID=UPI002FF17BA8